MTSTEINTSSNAPDLCRRRAGNPRSRPVARNSATARARSAASPPHRPSSAPVLPITSSRVRPSSASPAAFMSTTRSSATIASTIGVVWNAFANISPVRRISSCARRTSVTSRMIDKWRPGAIRAIAVYCRMRVSPSGRCSCHSPLAVPLARNALQSSSIALVLSALSIRKVRSSSSSRVRAEQLACRRVGIDVAAGVVEDEDAVARALERRAEHRLVRHVQPLRHPPCALPHGRGDLGDQSLPWRIHRTESSKPAKYAGAASATVAGR